jgi:ketosteroid isomerase-like protein
MQDEILKLEKDFERAIIRNDAAAVGLFLSDDWIIIDPDGGIIDKARFLGVIKSGTLSHDAMDSTEVRVRVYGDVALVTALTTTKGKFMGEAFTSRERAIDMLVKHDERWQFAFSQLTHALQGHGMVHALFSEQPGN